MRLFNKLERTNTFISKEELKFILQPIRISRLIHQYELDILQIQNLEKIIKMQIYTLDKGKINMSRRNQKKRKM
jgi:hypothetical protein